MLKMTMIAALLTLPVATMTPAAAQARPPKLDRCYVGQRVKTPGGLAATVVAAQGAGCTIRTDVKNTFIDGTFAAFILTPMEGSPPLQPLPGGTLPTGEYACYGSGMRILAGLGFKLLGGGVYTDLDNKSRGRYAITGSTITFTGGHLGGQTGRDIKNKGFTIGQMVSCQLWG